MANENILTQDVVRQIMDYKEKTGNLIWKKKLFESGLYPKSSKKLISMWNKKHEGKIAGSVDKSNVKSGHDRTPYIRVSFVINNKKIRTTAHRLIFFYMTGRWPCQIDHIDGNGLNNKWDNLREVDIQNNSRNQRLSLSNTSGFTGVTWVKKTKKWQVSIGIRDKNNKEKRIHGGTFADINEAIEKRKSLNIKYGFHKNHGKLK